MEEGSARLNVIGFFKVMGEKNWNRKMRLPTGMEPYMHSHDIVKIHVLYARVYKVRVLITSDGACLFEFGWAKFARDAKLHRGEFLIFNQILRNEYRVRVYESSACERDVLRGAYRDTEKMNNFASFFKVVRLKGNTSLRVPGDFVTRYEDTLARDSITLETEDATNRWVVQLARRSGDIYFQEGWSTFVQDNGLAEGDLVTVKVYVGLNKWSVSIYDPCGWRKIPTKVANIGEVLAPDSGPPVADCGSSRLDNVRLWFVRKFARYALKTNLDLPNTFALAMDRRSGGPVTLVTAAGSKYYASLRERDNRKGRRFYLAVGGWTEFCRERYVRSRNILLFTLSMFWSDLHGVGVGKSYETQLLNLIHCADKFSNSMLPECGF
ncbi:hypothetical protein C2S51_010759 [Perilla frutescens var. frutescens]|nr:hypothetical protein C2S51_010759 [Perilla frutescens var. frutescens]